MVKSFFTLIPSLAALFGLCISTSSPDLKAASSQVCLSLSHLPLRQGAALPCESHGLLRSSIGPVTMVRELCASVQGSPRSFFGRAIKCRSSLSTYEVSLPFFEAPALGLCLSGHDNAGPLPEACPDCLVGLREPVRTKDSIGRHDGRHAMAD